MSENLSPVAPLEERSEKSEKPFPLREIEAAIRGIRFGVVQIVIQDGVVIQIEKTEKVRLR